MQDLARTIASRACLGGTILLCEKNSSRFQEFQSCEESNISVSRSSGLQLDLGKQLLNNFLLVFFFFKVIFCSLLIRNDPDPTCQIVSYPDYTL
jgi:hypothetical protein